MSAETCATSADLPLSAEDIVTIAEYEKIIKFSEVVLAGRHPRFMINV
jgi:hypothetical protein